MPVYARGTITLPTAQADSLLQHWDLHVRLSRAETGCIHFSFTLNPDRTVITVDEKWLNKQAFDAHVARTRRSAWGQHSTQLARNIQITGMPTPRDTEEPVDGWTPPNAPPPDLVLEGRQVRLERLDAQQHGPALFQANSANANWDYLPYGPFTRLENYQEWIATSCTAPDPHFFAIIDRTTNRPIGVASYLRINPESGSIEVGHINFSPALQRTTGATEAMYLMMQWAFEAGYRRYEWKCNAANLASRRAAERLGLSFEGVFRQMMVVKGHNRDTAWFAAIDKEWPQLKAAFGQWLAADNFGPKGAQNTSLSRLTAPILVSKDPAFRD